jgi:hypothetical protein
MLTAAQIAHYRTFGYVVMRRCFSPAEVETIRGESLRALVAEYRHQPFDGTRRQWCCMLGDDAPLSASLLEDPRFFDVAEQLHGKVLPYWCDANRYVDPTTHWHPDIGDDDFAFAGVKYAIYLQPLRAQTGALRVIPGSHLQPLHDQVKAWLAGHAPPIDQVPAVACEVDPGDVIAFNFPLWHAAVGGAVDRALNTLAFYPYPHDEHERRYMAENMRRSIPQNEQGFGWRGEIYPERWIASAAANPRRRVVVERLRACGILDAARRAPAAV